MSTYENIFKRKELKYRITKNQHLHLVQEIQKHMQALVFESNTVSSLYFDSANNEIIERSLDKPLYKEKFRLRVYGEIRNTSPAYLELKKKYKGIVYKRRVAMSYKAATNYLKGMPYVVACQAFPLADEFMQEKSLSATSRQIVREIECFFKRIGALKPWMWVSCQREQWVAEEESLRITFDENLEYEDLFSQDSFSHHIIPDDEVIMEIKSAEGLPAWLVDLLSREEIYPSSFSKAGTAYKLSKQKRPRHLRRAS